MRMEKALQSGEGAVKFGDLVFYWIWRRHLPVISENHGPIKIYGAIVPNDVLTRQPVGVSGSATAGAGSVRC